MKTLLRIDASSRTQGSHSRKLADAFQEQWELNHPKGKVLHLDLVKLEIPHISDTIIKAFYTPESHLTSVQKKALEISDLLIGYLYESDELLISSPLYNLGVPSRLKALFDHAVRIGKTFMVDDGGNYIGLLNTKVAHLALVKGSYFSGTPMASKDYQEPYLEAILNYMGIEVKHIFSLEGTSYSNDVQENFNKLSEQIKASFKN